VADNAYRLHGRLSVAWSGGAEAGGPSLLTNLFWFAAVAAAAVAPAAGGALLLTLWRAETMDRAYALLCALPLAVGFVFATVLDAAHCRITHALDGDGALRMLAGQGIGIVEDGGELFAMAAFLVIAIGVVIFRSIF